MLLLTIAATVAAECGYMVLGTLLPGLSCGEGLTLAAGLHLLAHRLIVQHITVATVAQAAGAVLLVDLAIHILQLHGNVPRMALHLALVIAIHVLRQWRHRR